MAMKTKYRSNAKAIAKAYAKLHGKYTKAIRQAITPEIRAMSREVKATLPVRTKTLRKSIGYKIKTVIKTGKVYALIGARRNVIGWRKSGFKVLKPSRYLHLVENDVSHAGGRTTKGRHPLFNVRQRHAGVIQNIIATAIRGVKQ